MQKAKKITTKLVPQNKLQKKIKNSYLNLKEEHLPICY